MKESHRNRSVHRGSDYRFKPQIIEVGGSAYDLQKVTMYNSNYLDQTPPYILLEIEGNSGFPQRLEGEDALTFNRLFNESVENGHTMEPPVDFKYGIIAIRPAEDEGMADILHFCGYWEPPTESDYVALREELAIDEELGLVAEIDSLTLVEAPPEIVEIYRQMVETDPNWHEAN